MNNVIEKIEKISHRQLENEVITRNIIKKILKENNIKFIENLFDTSIPKPLEWYLIVAGQKIECYPSCLESGKIENRNFVIYDNFLDDMDKNVVNINYSSKTDSISVATHFYKHAITVSRKDINFIRSNIDKVYGSVIIEKKDVVAGQILVGNKTNPKNILFSHYDSIKDGFIDNLSGTYLLLKIIIDNPDLLDDNLFVFDGNEELSYDKPYYWGHGYRIFEKKYDKIMETSKRIFVADCIGHSDLEIIRDDEILCEGFPVVNLEKYKHKIEMVSGNFDKLMEFYHSDEDIKEKFHLQYFLSAYDYLIKELRK